MWMARVKLFSKGGDNRAKRLSNRFGHALCAAMDPIYGKVIDAEVQDGLLNLMPGGEIKNDGTIYSYADHKKIIEKMLSIVAKDSSTNDSRSLIDLGRKVFNC